MKKTCFLVAVLLAMVPSLAFAGWQDDLMKKDGAIRAFVSDLSDWQAGIRVEGSTRGYDSVGGFVSDDSALGESGYLLHKPSGLYAEVSNSNSFGDGVYFDNSQTYSVGLFREVVGDMFVKAGYAYTVIHNTPGDRNFDLHSVFGGLYLPRIFAGKYWDGLRFYGEARGVTPDDDSVLTGGLTAKVGAKTKLLIPEVGGVQLLPNGLDVDASAGGNDGIYGRTPDVLGFRMVRLSSRYDIGLISVEPYAVGITQSRPDQEENEFAAIGGIQFWLDFLK